MTQQDGSSRVVQKGLKKKIVKEDGTVVQQAPKKEEGTAVQQVPKKEDGTVVQQAPKKGACVNVHVNLLGKWARLCVCRYVRVDMGGVG